jgi:RNA polymerase sigma-70 factor (ECF subfamily)
MSEGRRAVAGRVIVTDAIAGIEAGGDALTVAVREHARLVYRVAYSVLRNHHDAEDATQETFVRVLRYGRKLEGVRDQRTWLARIAWRVAIDRGKRQPDLALDDLGPGREQLRSQLASADQIVITSETTRLLTRLIARLPVKLRDVITLSTVQEMSSGDIAQVLGIPESVVRPRLFRARQILKERMTALLESKHAP